MAVFRIEKTRDYTVMSNHHLRDKSLSLKAKGLLSLMLSLPEEWDYTTKGLARICKDGVDSICAGVRELEEHGYVIRQRVRNANGQLGAIEYTILEQPRPPEPKPGKPERENPVQVKPVLDSPVLGKPEQENPAQLNTKGSSNQISNTDSSSTEGSNPIQSSPQTPAGGNRAGRDWMREREGYRELILENIEYDILIQNERMDRDRLDELVELMVDTVCSRRETIRIAGDDYPAEVVKSRFLKLNSSHIEYVLDRMRENTTYVRNIKKYLLAALYNAPATIDSYGRTERDTSIPRQCYHDTEGRTDHRCGVVFQPQRHRNIPRQAAQSDTCRQLAGRSRAGKNENHAIGTARTKNGSPGRFLFENPHFPQVKSRENSLKNAPLSKRGRRKESLCEQGFPSKKRSQTSGLMRKTR